MTAIERALDTAFEAVLQMKLSAHGKAKFIEEFKRELEKACQEGSYIDERGVHRFLMLPLDESKAMGLGGE